MRPIIGVNGDCLWICGDVCHSPSSLSAPRSHEKLRRRLTEAGVGSNSRFVCHLAGVETRPARGHNIHIDQKIQHNPKGVRKMSTTTYTLTTLRGVPTVSCIERTGTVYSTLPKEKDKLTCPRRCREAGDGQGGRTRLHSVLSTHGSCALHRPIVQLNPPLKNL